MSGRAAQGAGLAWVVAALWLLVFAGIAADVIRKPTKHTTVPTYQTASTQWWQGVDPYTLRTHDGFLYFPQAAVLYTPFTWGPGLTGELAWRAFAFGLFALALWRLGRGFLDRGDARTNFLILTLLAVPCSLASLRNAQFDLPLAALVVLTAAEIGAARWTAAAVCLCVAVALKPLAVVPLLLFGAIYYKELLGRLALGLVIVLLLPFVHWNPAFAAHEYVRCVQTLLWAGQPHEPRFSDLTALLAHVGIVIPDALMFGLRVLCALVYLGLGLLAARRLGRFDASWVVGALAADYLMLFNPRTETCSFVFLGPFVATLALRQFRAPGRRALGIVLGVAAIFLACDAMPPIHLLTDRWLKPLIALLFLPAIIWFVLQPPSREEDRTNS